MLHLLRFFRPVLEWLEGRFAPAVVAAPLAVEEAPTLVAEPADVTVLDELFAGDDVALMAYVGDPRIEPTITAAGEAAALALTDAVFGGGFSYYHAETAVSDRVFAEFDEPVTTPLFAFLPPPRPQPLPPTPYYGGGEEPTFELVELPPEADAVEDDAEAELVEV